MPFLKSCKLTWIYLGLNDHFLFFFAVIGGTYLAVNIILMSTIKREFRVKVCHLISVRQECSVLGIFTRDILCSPLASSCVESIRVFSKHHSTPWTKNRPFFGMNAKKYLGDSSQSKKLDSCFELPMFGILYNTESSQDFVWHMLVKHH